MFLYFCICCMLWGCITPAGSLEGALDYPLSTAHCSLLMSEEWMEIGPTWNIKLCVSKKTKSTSEVPSNVKIEGKMGQCLVFTSHEITHTDAVLGLKINYINFSNTQISLQTQNCCNNWQKTNSKVISDQTIWNKPQHWEKLLNVHKEKLRSWKRKWLIKGSEENELSKSKMKPFLNKWLEIKEV